jgi:hypothetical protein
MRFVAAPILILLLFTQTFNKWVVILNYQLNKKYIAEKLCENREKPQLHCNGKCLFMLKMKATEEKEEAPVNRGGTFKVSLSETWSDCTTTFDFSPMVGEEKTLSGDTYLLKQYSAFLPAIFRPPLA